jgi:alanine dehydrogenase
MNIGIPKERRPYEYRVGLPPAGVAVFLKHGHHVYVEHDAGSGAGFSDDDYAQVGGVVAYSHEEVYGRSDLLLKFARPLMEEIEWMHSGQSLAGFLHLAAARQEKIERLISKSVTAIAYEQVETEQGNHPILAPLSQVGGRMVVQIASRLLQNDQGGRGILLGGVAGVPGAEVVIVGAGTVGGTAARAFMRAGAHVTVLDIDLHRLQMMQDQFQGNLVTLLSTPYNLSRACSYADVLLGAVLQPGSRAPVVVTRSMIAEMKSRAVIIDMSIDQGGCVETSRPTTHASPTFIEEGVIHYCVPNISGVLGRTASHALFNGAYPFLDAIAAVGVEQAIASLPELERGVVCSDGKARHLNRITGLGGARP